MMQKLVSIQLSDIVVPQTMITDTAPSELKFISKSLKEKQGLFFVIVTLEKKRYTLVDRHDVYLAAVKSNMRKIDALILSHDDTIEIHFRITMKSILNPVTIINSMTPYVQQYGLDETVNKLHLHSDFAKIYSLQLDAKILDDLNDIIHVVCNNGVRSVIPLSTFVFISKIKKDNLSIFMDSFRNLMKSKQHRWPHDVYLRKLEMGPVTEQRISEKKIPITDIPFCCEKCDTKYVVSNGVVMKSDDSSYDGVTVNSQVDTVPKIIIPTELVKHLGVSVKHPPKIISSTDIDAKDLVSHLTGRKFVIVLGENTG